jgi:dipeptidyl aminopeptidase/acylaminoacyl peptidase
MRRILTLFLVCCATSAWQIPAQQPATKPAEAFTLSVDSIMRGPKLIGSAPTGIRWAPDSSKIFFSWQKPNEERAQSYSVSRDGSDLRQLSADEARQLPATPTGRPDRTRKRMLMAENGDIVIHDVATSTRRPLVKTASMESNPRWARNDTAVTFVRDGNLYLISLDGTANSPAEVQLTDVAAPANETATQTGGARGAAAGGRGGGQGARGTTASDQALTESQRILRQEQQNLIDYIKRQAEQRQQGGRGGGVGGRRGGPGGPGSPAGPPPEPIARFQPTARQTVSDLQLSADESFVFVSVTERPEIAPRNQDVPNYVTESSYPEMISGRSNVGDAQTRRLLALLDLKQNKTVWADATAFAGNERPAKPGDATVPRILNWGVPEWSDDGSHYVISVRAQDNKDRWYVTIDPATGKATILDTLHDDAWIREQSIATGTGGGFGGPGGGGGVVWLPDNKRFLFLSEKDGWMHLYSLDVTAAQPAAKQLTSGKWEITNARMSNDRTKVFFTSTEVHPGERHFYTISVDGGPRTRITSMTGSNEATVSPDETSLAIIYSYSTKPPELYIMPFTPGAPARQVTMTPMEEWRAFKWIDPKVITYKARDGADVYARLFTPEMIGAKRDPRRPAVIFIHGAGYLQNAHKYWASSYYREYMFNNLLASRGYVVLDPDYRASSGYGRDWRTAIYQHMGGKDLDDVVDGAKFLAATEKVDPKRIGLYGGSYGGFLTLMGLFTTPDVFAAGAALRPVTDWAHYNHGYTSGILNLPQNDLEAYRRSSPIYFADGLKGQLLICHGMVDTNVFFQDSIRLVQRLIELRKETWAIAPYPVENHSFTQETSWADEYRRILRLFEENLRR